MHSKVEHESRNDEPVFYLLISNKYMPVDPRVKKDLELFFGRYHLIRHYCGQNIPDASLLGSQNS